MCGVHLPKQLTNSVKQSFSVVSVLNGSLRRERVDSISRSLMAEQASNVSMNQYDSCTDHLSLVSRYRLGPTVHKFHFLFAGR
jgi:hypothetical protein